MPLLSDADLDFALRDLSGATSSDASPNVAYTGASGPPQSCWGTLQRVPVQEVTVGGMQRVGTQITLAIRASALSGLVGDRSIVVDDASYTIRDTGTVRADGTRLLTLVPTVSS